MYNYNKSWYNNLNKSKLTPPNWVFSVVWPILYTTLFVSFLLIKNNKKCINFCNPLLFFTIQLVFNLIWTTLFFKLKKTKLALLDLIIIIIFTIITIYKFQNINILASYILLPYLFWLLFALYLNTYIVIYN